MCDKDVVGSKNQYAKLLKFVTSALKNEQNENIL